MPLTTKEVTLIFDLMETPHLATLDLAISNMDTQVLEENAAAAIKAVHGVHDLSVIERGAIVHYDPKRVHPPTIIDALQIAGFNAVLFQDSDTGETGTVKF